MRIIILPLLALGLPGCSVFHSNVKGGFACGAARGIGTCAPSTMIDDGAIQEIEARRDASDSQSAQRTTIPAQRKPVTTGPSRAALRVVYPDWRDGSGHVHKRTVAYVNVEAPADLSPADGHMASVGTGANLLAIAERAPDLALVSPTAPQAGVASANQQPAPAGAIGPIQAQVRDILAKAPKPITPKPATPQASDTTFPPKGD